MATLNKVMLIGRLTENPEAPRTLPGNKTVVVKFRIAVGRSRKKEDGTWESDPNTLYIDCEAFGPAEAPRLPDLITQYTKKGSQIYVEGRLQYDTWDDKENPGHKRSKHKIVVDSIQFLDPRDDSVGAGQSGQKKPQPQPQKSASRGNPYEDELESFDPPF